jgi:hypothetical protein
VNDIVVTHFPDMSRCLSTDNLNCLPFVERPVRRESQSSVFFFHVPNWHSIEPINNRRPSPICILNDDVLLNIFHLYRLGVPDEYEDRNGKQTFDWGRQRWWYMLAQVSRRWRHVILGSPSRLDLHLLCTYGVPVADMLAHSPPLPLIVSYIDPDREMTTEDEEGVLLALLHSDRVRRISLKTPASKLGKFITALDDQFPILERVYMRPQSKEDTRLIFPQTFQAPHLRHLNLVYTALPTRSPLLTTTGDLVTLRLMGIPRSAYFPPGFILARLSLLPQLERLGIAFHSPLPNRDVVKQLWDIPTMTHVTLPNLRLLIFGGVSTYIEGLLERIGAPVLDTLQIRLFNQLTFTVPRLSQFLQASENRTFHTVELAFKSHFVHFIADPHRSEWNPPLRLEIMCRHLDWQVASAVQILGTISPVLSVVENLTLSYGEHDPPSEQHNEIDRTQWHELLRPFGNVKTLYVENNLVEELSHSLCPEEGEVSLALLPNLQELQYSGGGSNVRDAFTPFINERQTAGHPVCLTSSS